MSRVVVLGPASQALGIRVARKLGVETVDTEFKQFPDGEVYARVAVNDEAALAGQEAIVVQSCGAGRGPGGSQNARLVQLVMIVNALARMDAASVRVVVPYLAYGRQDKVFRPGECIFAHQVVTMIERAGATAFYTVDVHAETVLEALSIPAWNVSSMPALAEYLNTKTLHAPVVVSPDKGAVKRSHVFADYLGEDVPVEAFYKARDVVTGEIEMTGELAVADRDVVVADDIISTGGTMSSAIEISKQSGARRVFAVCTHPLLIQNAVARLYSAGAEEVIGTDSIDSEFSVVSLAGVIADALTNDDAQ